MEWNQPQSKSYMITDPIKLVGEVIQIGAVKLDENFRYLGDISISIAPKYYTEINKYVGMLTGIETGDLAKGLLFPKAYEQFIEWCGNEFTFITWGPDDMNILASNIAIHNIKDEKYPSYDLQRIFNAQITKESRQWALASAMELLNLQLDLPCHDARNDAIYTARIISCLDMKKGLAEYIPPAPKENKPKRGKYDFLEKLLLEKDEYTTGTKITCPECNKPLNLYKKTRLRCRDKIALANCEDGNEYLVILKRDSVSENGIKYEKRIYRLCDKTRAFYNKMKSKTIKG